jgi:NADH-quinone oxidoreductase subunit L
MGGLKGKLPVTYWTFLIYTLAISGIPLTSGFLSKDSILAGTLAFAHQSGHVLIPVVAFTVAGLTAFYMFRLVFLTFHGGHRDPERVPHLHESPALMTVPLATLALFSLFFWFSTNPLDAAEGWLVQSVPRPESVVPAHMAAPGPAEFAEEMHHQHTTAMALSLAVALTGILVAWLTYRKGAISADRVAARVPGLHRFLENKWFFDEMYDTFVVEGTHAFTRMLRWIDETIVDGLVNGAGSLTRVTSTVSGWFDRYVVDGLVNAAAWISGFGGLALRKTQTGRVQTYLFFVVVGVLVFYILFRLG